MTTNLCCCCEESPTHQNPLRLLECCQLQSEAQHKICRTCVGKLDMCPLCRSSKKYGDADICYMADMYEMEHFTAMNLQFAFYKYKMTQYFTDRISALEYYLWLDDPRWEEVTFIQSYEITEPDIIDYYSSTSNSSDLDYTGET